MPRRIFRILADFPEQIILFIGLTSLDDARNRSVEPGCPPATARLANFALAREYNLPYLLCRFDPTLPGVDDAPGKLLELLEAVARHGARQVSAAYLFLTPLANRDRLAQDPYLRAAIPHCADACPTEDGVCFSVPLGRKIETSEWLHAECAKRGLSFGTCGCKDLRMIGSSFPTSCSYPYLAECSGASRKRPTSLAISVRQG
ncbi:MAG: hypothetical protein U0793_14645 [Gemmataceae bacterium]